MIVLGIDPGTATTGYGIIEKRGRGVFKCLASGTINTKPSQATHERLNIIYKELSKIIRETQPDILVMERIFLFKNFKTIITVSQAQGIIMLAAAKKKIPLYQFTPLQVKLTVVGYGKAQKKEVEKKVKQFLKLRKLPSKSDDAVDALAIALTYYFKNEKGSGKKT